MWLLGETLLLPSTRSSKLPEDPTHGSIPLATDNTSLFFSILFLLFYRKYEQWKSLFPKDASLETDRVSGGIFWFTSELDGSNTLSSSSEPELSFLLWWRAGGKAPFPFWVCIYCRNVSITMTPITMHLEMLRDETSWSLYCCTPYPLLCIEIESERQKYHLKNLFHPDV